MEIRYNAIVLRKKEVGETDRLYTLYTETSGKVSLLAKGVRKSEAKLAGQLETLMQGMIIVVKGRGAGRIAGAVAENNFLALRSDGDILQSVLEAVSMFDRLIEWDDKDPDLFRLLFTYIHIVNECTKQHKKDTIMLITSSFLFQVFSHLGYAIDTTHCVASGTKLVSGKKYFFSPSAGGVIMMDSSSVVKDAFPMSENMIKILRLFLTQKLENIVKVQMDKEDLREIFFIAKHFFDWIKQ